MPKRKITATDIFFGIVDTLQDFSRLTSDKEKKRPAIQAVGDGLLASAKTLIADLKDDETLVNWACHAVLSESTELMLSFPERGQGEIFSIVEPRSDWEDIFRTSDLSFLQACHSRGIKLEAYQSTLLRRALKDGTPELRDFLLKAVAPYTATVYSVLRYSPKTLSRHADFICDYLRIAIKADPSVGAKALQVAVDIDEGIHYAVLRLCGAEAEAGAAAYIPDHERLGISNHRWIAAMGGHCRPEALLADAG
jgi:hypothetical protein